MSYEAWRREVANGTMPEYDEGRERAAAHADSHLCCINRLASDPPTTPHQACRICHSPLPWFDADDPERGFFDADHEMCAYCTKRPMSDDHYPYCSTRCGINAETEGD